MAIIIPCAGKSSRYSTFLPKYMLHYNKDSKFYEKIVEPYIDKEDIYFIIPSNHEKKYGSISEIKNRYKKNKNIKVFNINRETSGPAETINELAKKINTNIFIKDCDSFFDLSIKKENSIAVVNLKKYPKIKNIISKSFAIFDKQLLIKDITEKEITSNFICCGGYSFESSKQYNYYYQKLKKNSSIKEIFVSHIIKSMIIDNKIFKAREVRSYLDLGTNNEYLEFLINQKNLFIQLEGTIFKSVYEDFSERSFNSLKIITKNTNLIKNYYNSKEKIIFFTSFDRKFRKKIENKLIKLNFSNFEILTNLNLGPSNLITNINKSMISNNLNIIHQTNSIINNA